MAEPTITCPSCSAEIRVTESLAAPLIQATREEYEARIARKDAEVTRREADIKVKLAAIDKDRQSIEQQVAEKLEAGRRAIAAEEARKAKAAAAVDLQSKVK